MYYLIKQPQGRLDVYEESPEIETVLQFVETVHQPNTKTKSEISSLTTVAHLRKYMIAISSDKDSLVGAAAVILLYSSS